MGTGIRRVSELDYRLRCSDIICFLNSVFTMDSQQSYSPFSTANNAQPSGLDMQRQPNHENGASNTQQPAEPTTGHINLISDKPIKIVQKVAIPVKQFPKFNFVGKLLGPKGLTLKRLQEETLTRMAILGKGSMRDKDKEEEQRKEGGKYAHLSEELHVQVEAYAPPAEAHSRLAHALSELKRYLIPELNDDIRQQQLEELAYYNGSDPAVAAHAHQGHHQGHHPPPAGPPPTRGRGRGRPPAGPGRGSLLATPGPGGRGRGVPPPTRGRGAARPVPGRAPPAPPAARYEEEYGYEEYGAEAGYETYDTGYSQTEEYYDYGHGHGRGYDAYSESWPRPAPAKAPPQARPPKTDYRAHPYSRPPAY